MIQDAEQVVRRVAELTGAALPALLDADSPALAEPNERGIYLVGLIGGKEVGKSALVNALVGREITEQTSHGPGTQSVIAYAHSSNEEELSRLLRREVGERFQIVSHDEDRLAQQVLLDLPDIDSRFAEHLEITRRMLRVILFPIWIQSVEKYADAQPRNLLARVAAGNDPSNFLFCLNKADQMAADEDVAALREDYARRLRSTLALPAPPDIFVISALQPERWDMPSLRKLLSRSKEKTAVADSLERAGRRRRQSLIDWLDRQDLPRRQTRLARLEESAGEMISQRVGVPLMETMIPAILDDPAYRTLMADGAFARRVARWPIVGALHALLSPLRYAIRQNAGPAFTGMRELVAAHMPEGAISSLVQSVFAYQHQTDPEIGKLYSRDKLWDAMAAQDCESRLRSQIAGALDRQKVEIESRPGGGMGIVGVFFRNLLTIGALIWFPLVQPILQNVLADGLSLRATLESLPLAVVKVFSAPVLLENAAFLIFWYLVIWAALRWMTRRSVDRFLDRCRSADAEDDSLSLAGCAMAWMGGLCAPIRGALAEFQELVESIERLRRPADQAPLTAGSAKSAA